MSDSENRELLHILESRGLEFLNSFGPSFVATEQTATSSRAAKRRKIEDISSDEEWTGIHGGLSEDDVVGHALKRRFCMTANACLLKALEEESRDEEYGQQAKVVIFSDQHISVTSPGANMSKAQLKAFMSSKVTKLREEVIVKEDDEEDTDSGDDDLTNAQNDALLHRLVHTRLLSGSLESELNLTSAQRKKALAGRVIEVAGKARLGKGERLVRSAERNKAAKRVREGLADKQEEQRKKELEEAKQLGIYHPVLKTLYDGEEKRTKRKREKGLAMGVGSFKGGVLRLRKEDLSSLNESAGGQRGGGTRRKTARRK